MKISDRYVGVLLMAVILLVGLYSRLAYADRFTTADETRWLANVRGFATKLSQGRLGSLVQQPHPGITTQWFAAATTFSDDWAVRKIPLVLWQCVLVAAIAYVFAKLLGFWPGLFLAAVLATSPLLVAHTRVYAMDSLLALFCLLALGLLCLWDKTKSPWHLVLAAATTSAAILSKLPGAVLVPVGIVWIFISFWGPFDATRGKQIVKALFLYAIAGLLAACLILPSFAIHPLNTIGDFTEFFRSDDYNELHKASPYYYASTIWFLASPLEWFLLAGGVYLMFSKKLLSPLRRRQMALLLLFSLLFILIMTFGAKKGDRYILPAITVLNAGAAYIVVVFQQGKFSDAKKMTGAFLLALLIWQAIDVVRLTPYTLAYVNPLAKPFLGERRTGWGEGLDLAALYLNGKPGAPTLKVASTYPNEFQYRFRGEAVALHKWEEASIDYAVVYRASLQRGPDSWEQDVINHLQGKQPEKIIYLNSIPYVWIYRLD
ncbi:MAG: glycosyltransferase family 39 protein [Candidatus Andersenbacteria bacterium]|nr:glycosyltransferase family 39 protein [Candidatus Andersenbacteria bacterium]